jgi:eukaryotic-like serine/threonine-protein kinase
MEEHTAWRVPGYAVEELIGFGGSGEVWRGRCLRTGATVAFKRLRQGACGPADQARLLREAALLSALDHPHLLRVHAVLGSDAGAVLVLDYAAGGCLGDVLQRRGRLRAGEIVTVLAPLAVALSHVHGEGLVHGDVTPANILFTADGRPLLADLGVARVLGEPLEPRMTPQYADPAVVAGVAPGPATDVFMLAAVALHALTGSPPWPAQTAAEALAMAAAGDPPGLAELPGVASEPLARVLVRALSRQPAERGTAAELALDLRHACPPEPVRLISGSCDGAARPGLNRPADSSAALTHALRVPPGRRSSARPAPADPPDPRRRGVPVEPGGVRAGQSVRRLLGVTAVVLLGALGGIGWAAAGSRGWPADPASHALAGAAVERDTPAPRPAAAVASPGTGAAARTRSPVSDRDGPLSTSALSWLAVLQSLDALRARAYDLGDVGLLHHVYAAGEHLTADTRQLRSIVASGCTVRGVRHRLRQPAILAQTRDRVRLRVLQSLPASTRLQSGQVLERVAGTAEAAITVDLLRTPDGWRLA